MTVESGVFTLLSSSDALATAAGVLLADLPSHVIRSGAVIDPPVPFLAIRWEEPAMTGRLGAYGLTLRAHDRDLSYDRISAMLNAAKKVLTAVVHQQGITQVDWRGRSPDLADDGYKTLTRFDTYVVLGGMATREEV